MTQPIQLIVGLGNPGPEYTYTRHNAGAWYVAALANRYNGSLREDPKYFGLTGRIQINGHDVRLLIPTTFMNLSGVAVREAVKFYKAAANDIIVIHDDLDLPAGRLRIRERGGSGGHRGIGSILAELGTDEFVRVRFGVGRPPEGWDSADYVLGKFAKDEQEPVREAVMKAADAVEAIMKEGAAPAMNRFNRLN